MTSNEMALMGDITVEMQEDRLNEVLDKIKTEIQKEENIWYHDCEPDFSKDFDVIRVDTVLSIIDKYRESEEA